MDENAQNPQEKKIIIDEDWKAKAQAEKEELARKQESEKAPEGKPQRRGPLPPPSLELLATSLAMQATAAMGLVPNPLTGRTEADLEQAKHVIDTIALLSDKTEGNRTAEETAVLDELLHQLRLSYVMAAQHKKL
ncbi:MAG: DUF1844 domain-containing protein [Thermoguttaceae bacterium]